MRAGAPVAIQGHEATLMTEAIYIPRIAKQKREAVSVELKSSTTRAKRQKMSKIEKSRYVSLELNIYI